MVTVFKLGCLRTYLFLKKFIYHRKNRLTAQFSFYYILLAHTSSECQINCRKRSDIVLFLSLHRHCANSANNLQLLTHFISSCLLPYLYCTYILSMRRVVVVLWIIRRTQILVIALCKCTQNISQSTSECRK